MSTTIIPSEEVVRWRNSVGSKLTAKWNEHRQNDIQLLVIFGVQSDDRALHTPLAMVTHEDPEVAGDELMARAASMWSLPIDTTNHGVYDIPIASQCWRIVIATSTPTDKELADDLFLIVHDGIERNFPNELVYGPVT